MKLKKSPFAFLLLVIAIFVGLSVTSKPSSIIHADGQGQATLTIVKYGLKAGSSGFSSNQTINTGEPINNLPTDDHGNELEPLAGIHYKIQEVLPVNSASPSSINVKDSSTYTKLGTASEIVTDARGVATILVNSNGDFIISEIANPAQHLSKPAPAFLVELPVVASDGTGNLSTVYIYPKSSIDKEESTGNSKEPSVNNLVTENSLSNGREAVSRALANTSSVEPSAQRFLPHTGDETSWLMMVSGGLLILLLIFFRRRKKDEELEEVEFLK